MVSFTEEFYHTFKKTNTSPTQSVPEKRRGENTPQLTL